MNFNIFGVFRKKSFFFLGGGGGEGGMKILWIFLGVHHEIGLVLGVISMYFRVNVQNGDIFFVGGGCKNFKDFFLVNSRCCAKPTYEEKMRVPLPPPGPRSNCSCWNSLIWVHTVCYTCFQNTTAVGKADDLFCQCW